MPQIDPTKVDLNAPAFGPGSQTLEDLMAARTPDEPSVEVPPQVVEVPPVVEQKEEEPVTSVEENKVSYSRFKTIHTRALEAEREAEKWRARAEEIEQSRFTRREEEVEGEMPSYWKELYGDSESSEKAWKIQLRREQEIEQRAYDAGQRGALELRQVEAARVNQNLATIDDHFEDLSALVGRDLTEKEQSAILDIVDDYTAKDEDGSYIGAIMPFEKAWEVYELKKGSTKAPQRQARDAVATIAATTTQGEPSLKAEQDKNWNPLDWNAWKKRV